MVSPSLTAILMAVRQHLVARQALGIEALPAAPALRRFLTAGSRSDLDSLARATADCQRCPLAASRRQVVFGSGSRRPALVIVGAWPDTAEDESGQPFPGEAGELLDRMLQAIGLTRAEIFCTLAVKCRPPDREPTAAETGRCLEILRLQLGHLAPRLVMSMGAFPARVLLASDQSFFALRGRLHAYAGHRLLPTFHPAFLLRQPDMKRTAWQDLQLARDLCRQTDARA
ncbi:MAG: uracil-DNA glycosylase [Thermodesulfobacteriota bacterium]